MGISCSQKELTEKLESGWNLRPESELLLAFSGSVRLIGSDGSQVFTLREGEGAFIPPYAISNAMAADGRAVIRSVFFQTSALAACGIMDFAPLISSCPSFISISATSARKIDEACIVIAEHGYLYQMEASILISSVMLALFRERAVSSEMTWEQDRRLQRMMSFIKDHSGEGIHLKDIAETAFVSERECLRIFSSSLGISPIQFLISCRIREAERLLRESSCNISEIAYAVGFSSLSHFSATFRRKHGIAPSEYRRRELS